MPVDGISNGGNTLRVGEVVHIGQHRLCCGDAGNPVHVAALFNGAKPDLVFTSPPYLQQRAYGKAIACWDTLMQSVFAAMPHHERTQVLVNLGLVHRKGEWLPYWDGWVEWMRVQGWRRFGWYVWDQGNGMPGDWAGRLSPSYEFLFHFCRQPRRANKTVACKHAGRNRSYRGTLNRKGSATLDGTIAPLKIADNVVRVNRAVVGNIASGHPAVFPVALPLAIHAAYTDPGELVYDPCAGSGTSILAAMRAGRRCYAMELEPSYCDIALKRIEKEIACQSAPQ